jgi:hypothetical protein
VDDPTATSQLRLDLDQLSARTPGGCWPLPWRLAGEPAV